MPALFSRVLGARRRFRANAVVLAAAVAGAMAQAQPVTTWSGLATAVGAVTPLSNTITLGSAVAYDSGAQITVGQDVVFDADPGGTTISGSDATSLFVVRNGATLTVNHDLALENAYSSLAGPSNAGVAVHLGRSVPSEGTGKLQVNGSLFLENNSGATSALYLDSGGVAIEENLIVRGNTSTSTNMSAVYLPSTPSGGPPNSFLVKGNAVFDGNTTAETSAALRNWIESTTIEGNATFTNNTAQTGSGGAVSTWRYLSIGGDVTFAGNQAPGTAANGGALEVNGLPSNLASETFTTFGGDALFENNLAGHFGGAIYSRASNELVLNVLSADRSYTGNVAQGGTGAATASAGGFLYAGATGGDQTTTGLNVGPGRTLTIGTCTADVDSIASADSTAILNKRGPGVLAMASDNAFFKGTINVQGGTLLAGCEGSAVPVFSPNATYAVAAGAVLSANGWDGHSVGALENSGTVRTGSPASAPGVTLAVGNAYAATGGASLWLNTDLDSQASDVFLVQGALSGMTTLGINHAGSGAATTGDGIRVVQTSVSNPQDHFAMTPFVAGAFQYSLVPVGNALYLQSAPYAGPASSAPIPLLPISLLLALSAGMAVLGGRLLRAKD